MGWFSGLILPLLLTVGVVASKRLGRTTPFKAEDFALGFDLALTAIGSQLAALTALVNATPTRLTSSEEELGFALLGALLWYLLVLAIWMRKLGYDDDGLQPRPITGVAMPTGVSMLALVAVYAANARLLGA